MLKPYMIELKNHCHLPGYLCDLVGSEFDHDPWALTLVESFLQVKSHQRKFCLELLEIARGGRSFSWELRRLAILMLEHQILKLPPDDSSEFAFLFRELGITSADGVDGYVSEAVLKEGYTTTRMADFVREFRLRLSRLNRVHLALRGNKTSIKALGDFIHASRIECKLSLARYVLTPAEVVDRITGQLIRSTGVRDRATIDQLQVGREIDHCLERLPRFEFEIVRLLCEASVIYWVSDTTSAEINSMVEYPLNTVVMVVKPPGSHVEFEIKRAGIKGSRPLGAVYERDGYEVPSTHRLHAGSMAYYLRWEAAAAANLSKLYRLIHQREAPISRTLSVSTIYAVPVNGDEQHIVTYFSDFSVFRNPDEKRLAMRRAIAAFRTETGVSTPALPGDFGLATQFLGQVVPSQSILMGTSSFRLDRLASYLSPQGADLYFGQGLHVSFTRDQARRFADELLEEVLGVYTPPSGSYRNHDQYIESALHRSDNRKRADTNYLSIMREIGTFWGTLLGIKSHTHGESFVGRNAALKAVFENGEWKVKIVFLDHDATHLIDITTNHFHPLYLLPGMTTDEKYILGAPNVRGETDLLRAIYRVDQTVASEGHLALNDALGQAYKKTHSGVCGDPRLEGRFSRGFVEGIRDWHQIVVRYLSVKDDPSKVDSWRAETTRLLQEKGYGEALLREYLRSVEKYSGFLQKYSFLY
ncbi:MAG: hypothetical protein WAU45_23465 [Blastocatellia bacterium]